MTQPVPATPLLHRVAHWDNARFIIIVLVVLAHAISTIRTDTALGYGIYTYIYLFHMPAMIALAGLFSKADPSPRALRSTIQLIVTWLIWEAIWAVINALESGRDLPERWLVAPAWTLWFLVTLATMRILLPYLAQLRHPLLFSIIVALLAGFSPEIGTAFSASRTLSFMPFFVLGWLAMKHKWVLRDWFAAPNTAMKTLAAGVLALVAVGVAVVAPLRSHWRIDTWLVWRDGYQDLFRDAPVFGWAPTEWWQTALGGSGVRLLFLIIAAVMTLAVMILIPRSNSIITVWGTRTLYVYLLHGPIIYFMRTSGVVEWFGQFDVAGIASLIAIAIALSVVLSLEWVTKIFKPVIEPNIEWVFQRRPEK